MQTRTLINAIKWLFGLACGALLLLVLAAPAHAAPPTFDEMLFFGTGDDDGLMAVGDMDGDGDLDVVTTDDYHQSWVYLNDGDGSMSSRSPFGLDPSRFSDVAVGDMDGDGDLDMVTSSFGDPLIYVNDGSGTFPITRAISSDAFTLALGDLDGDGDLDLVAGTEQVEIHSNDGEAFSRSQVIDTGISSYVTDIVLGDLDGDGDLDLILVAAGEPGQIYLNDGNAFFQDRSLFGDDIVDASLALGDLDGDGDLDVVLGDYMRSIVAYMNDGAASFGITHTVEPNRDLTLDVTLADVDGDGDLDVAAGNMENPNKIYLNDGSACFSSTLTFGSGTDQSSGLATGDMDADGDLDLVTFNRNEQNVIYLNSGGGALSLASAFSRQATSLAVGDMDGDGDLDIVAGGMYEANFDEDNTAVYLNDGLGSFSGRLFGARGGDPDALAVGDMDGDMDLDVIVAYQDTANVLVFNDGSAHFPISRTFGLPAHCLAVGDLDGDGDLDLAAGYFWGQNALYFNDGGGHFPISHTFGSEEGSTGSLAVGDLDGDGDLDLVAGNEDEQNVIYLNDGSAHFPISRTFGTGTDATLAVALGDMDGDGDLDILAGNFGGPNMLYPNAGGGSFPASLARRFGTGTDSTSSLAVGDMDGDGDLDIVTGNSSVWWGGGPNVVYLNDGHAEFGRLAPARGFGTGTDFTHVVAVGDMDGDGLLDIIAGNEDNSEEPPILLRANDDLLDGAAAEAAFYSSAVYLNRSRRSPRLLTNPPLVAVTRPTLTADAPGQSAPEILSGLIPIPYRLFQPESAPVGYIRAYYSPDGGGRWYPAVAPTGTVTTNLASLPLLVGPFLRDDAYTTSEDTLLSVPAPGVLANDSDPYGYLPPLKAYPDTPPQHGALSLALSGSFVYTPAPNFYGDDSFVYLAHNGVADAPAVVTITVTPVDDDAPVAVADAYQAVVNLPLAVTAVDGVLANDADPDNQALTAVLDNPPAHGTLTLGQAGDLVYTPTLSYSGTDSFTYHASDGVLGSNVVTVTIDVIPALFYDDMESGAGKWNTGGTNSTWALDDSNPHGGAWAWFAQNLDELSEQRLVMRTPVHLDGPARLHVWHAYNTEEGYDGGVIEISADGGAWTDLGLAMLQNGYVDQLPSSYGNPLGGRLAFTGDSGGYVETVVELGAYSGSDIRIRFRLGTDESYGAEGWYVDDVLIAPALPVVLRQASRQPELPVIQWTSPSGSPAAPGALAGAAFQAAFSLTNTHVFTWDTAASGFFGQSDNVVFRIEAYPGPVPSPVTGTYRYTHGVPGPYQWPYAAATTFPFRVRGSQVQVFREGGRLPVQDALVYRLPAGQPGAASHIANNAGQAYRTDAHGYLQGRAQLYTGDQLVALAPVSATGTYTLYHTSAAPSSTGLDSYVIRQPGIQTLAISLANPLLLFNLDVSLEWDARNDGSFLADLEDALGQASAVLYDVSDGQAALGEVRLHQAKAGWLSSDIVVYAQNGIRPRASMGGVADSLTDDVYRDGRAIPNAYGPGQIRMGPNWDPFGQSLAELSQDWSRALAHELSHYLFYLPDNYIGLGPDGGPIDTDCKGSFMTSTYDEAYSEFLPRPPWEQDPECLKTMAEHTTGRADWDTLRRFYPALVTPTLANAGPGELPLDVTRLVAAPVEGEANTLLPNFFDLRSAASGDLLAVRDAQAYLFKTGGTPAIADDSLVHLGSSVGGGDRVKLRGAEAGDRLCVLGPYGQGEGTAYAGCVEALSAQSRSVPLSPVVGWRPALVVQSVTSRTLAVTVTLAVSAADLQVQVFPAYGAPTATAVTAPAAPMYPLSPTQSAVFTQLVTLDEPAFEGWVRAWVPGAGPVREALSQFFLSPPWGPNMRGGYGGNTRAWGANKRQLGAPAASGDGQVTIFNTQDIFADTGTVSLQALGSLPDLPAWLTLVGQGYRFVSGQVFSRTITFDYLQREAPAGYEHTLHVYHLPDGGADWQRLPTNLDTSMNRATATMPDNAANGQGVYALLSTVDMPPLQAGWNQFGYPLPGAREVASALASIEGAYSAVYHYDTLAALWRLHDEAVGREHPDLAGLVNDLAALEFGRSYWLYATAAVTPYLGVTVEGEGRSAARVLAEQPGQPPATLYGLITPTAGFSPAAGDLVTVSIDGVVCGEGQVSQVAGVLAYKLHLQAGCGGPGKTLVFAVNGQVMAETYTLDGTAGWNRQAWYHELRTPAAALSAFKTLDAGGQPLVPLGGVVSYTLVLSNSGAGPARGVVLSDVLPAAVSFGGWIAAGSAQLPPPGRAITWGPHDIPAHTAYTIRFAAIVTDNPAYYGQTVANMASFSSTDAGAGAATVSFAIEGVPPAPALAITKTVAVLHSPPRLGEPLAYTIIVANAGSADAPGVVLSDTLPEGISGSGLYWTGTLTAGARLDFSLPALLTTNVAYYGHVITNTAYLAYGLERHSAQAALTVQPGTLVYLPLVIKNG
ncbi:MAG: VCBS repeat-containing protein [Thermoflexales bacterium]|nr:VCBS repeat-containing protein [Thermoflexales bacterium]